MVDVDDDGEAFEYKEADKEEGFDDDIVEPRNEDEEEGEE